jgi:hypothetical protein
MSVRDLFVTSTGAIVSLSETGGYAVTMANGHVLDFLSAEGAIQACQASEQEAEQQRYIETCNAYAEAEFRQYADML